MNCKVEFAPIDGVEISSDNLTGRAGLALFSKYLSALDLMPHIERLFGAMRKSGRGLSITSLFKQVLCFFLDGTSSHAVQFDRLKVDRGYAGAIETNLGPDGFVGDRSPRRVIPMHGEPSSRRPGSMRSGRREVMR